MSKVNNLWYEFEDGACGRGDPEFTFPGVKCRCCGYRRCIPQADDIPDSCPNCSQVDRESDGSSL